TWPVSSKRTPPQRQPPVSMQGRIAPPGVRCKYVDGLAGTAYGSVASSGTTMAKKPGASTRGRQQRRGGTPARNRGARPSGAERPAPPAPVPATRRWHLCGEATSGGPRHASAAERLVALPPAIDGPRE